MLYSAGDTANSAVHVFDRIRRLQRLRQYACQTEPLHVRGAMSQAYTAQTYEVALRQLENLARTRGDASCDDAAQKLAAQ